MLAGAAFAVAADVAGLLVGKPKAVDLTVVRFCEPDEEPDVEDAEEAEDCVGCEAAVVEEEEACSDKVGMRSPAGGSCLVDLFGDSSASSDGKSGSAPGSPANKVAFQEMRNKVKKAAACHASNGRLSERH